MTATWRKACVGVDIGGTNLRFALVDGNGAILLREHQQTEINLGRQSFLDKLLAGIASMIHGGEVLNMKVEAIGLGIPGLIAGSGLILSSVNLLAIEMLNLKDIVSEATGLPVIAVNDANASAFGEKMFGAGKEIHSLLLLTLGTGVGSGLILDDKLWIGIDGVAAEYGHATVEPDGLTCHCGNRGCLEQYASASALVRAAVRALAEGRTGMLAELPRSSLSAEEIAAAAREQDPLAVELFESAGRYLGIAVATIANLLNLEAVILSGGVAASFDLLIGSIRKEIRGRAFAVPASRIEVMKGRLGDDAGILGAAALAAQLIHAV